MAYSKFGLLNLVSGNVRNCTFYLMNGQQVVRSKAPIIQNPRTQMQQSNRENIKPLLAHFRQLKPIIYLSLNDREQNQTAYNKFISINLNRSIVNGVFNPSKLALTTNSFPSTTFSITRQIDYSDNFTLTWTDDTDNHRLSSDKLICAYYDCTINSFQYAITRKSRSDLAATASFKLKSQNPHVIVYAFFVRSDYSSSSVMEQMEFIPF